MTERLPRCTRPLAACLVVAACLVTLPTVVAEGGRRKTMRFAADMAARNNWREASFRWNQLVAQDPEDPALLNNLAVAAEAMGDVEAARDFYVRALGQQGHDPRIDDNARRFERTAREARGPDGDESGDAGAPVESLPRAPAGDKRGKAEHVTVKLPVPARLHLGGDESILVASFLAPDTDLLDVNRELVRYLRSEFRKRTSLRVLDVVPVPAVPEQTVEDLVANAEFWRYLSREHGADLILSGVIGYDRQDVSGFRDVDTVSSRTGQKVRRTEFVEQEQFTYVLDLFFFEGPTGHLLYRDRLQRRLVFSGAQNDPIAAFYELSDSIAGDVLAVVTQRTREDVRVIFAS